MVSAEARFDRLTSSRHVWIESRHAKTKWELGLIWMHATRWKSQVSEIEKPRVDCFTAFQSQ